MRRLTLAGVVSLALVFAATAGSAATTDVRVQILKTGFVPQTVTINQNDSVTWKNADTVDHQIVANGGQFASAIIRPRQTYTHVFGQAGTYRYHDALHPKLTGTVTVKGAPPQVTLATSLPIVTFGTGVTLSGTVSSKKAGEKVTLVQLPVGQTTKQVIATLQTGTGGTFSFAVTPQIGTAYQAQWKGAESSVTVQVAPLAKMPAPSRSGYFHFYVTSATSYAGRFVFLQRFTQLGQWISFERLTLGPRSGHLIAVSSIARLIPRGRWSIRIWMSPDQVGPGYLEAKSGSQPVVRRR